MRSVEAVLHSSVGDGANAFKHFGGYVCKGPISDKRILRVENGKVTISVEDRDSGEPKPVRIEAVEFVRRYLQHALTTGYYGFLHPRAKARLAAIREQLGARLQAKGARRPDRNQTTGLVPPRAHMFDTS